MSQINSNAISPTPLRLDERKALLWVRKHQPTPGTHYRDPDAPSRPVLLALIQRGLIGLWPGRRRYDPLTYSLTEAGQKALEP